MHSTSILLRILWHLLLFLFVFFFLQVPAQPNPGDTTSPPPCERDESSSWRNHVRGRGCSGGMESGRRRNEEGLMRMSVRHRDDKRSGSRREVVEWATGRDWARMSGMVQQQENGGYGRRIRSGHGGRTLWESSTWRSSRRRMEEDLQGWSIGEEEDGHGELAETGMVEGSVVSGAALGSGEYLVDVYVGTPPRRFSLIIDTGSDLIWAQCHPCRRCYPQRGPIFQPSASTSYRLLPCSHPDCRLVYHGADADDACAAGTAGTGTHHQYRSSCRYSYGYGDSSNTSGELALETFTLSLPDGRPFRLHGVVFGCGHSNQGLFAGAAGLLGLGRGPLSFPSQIMPRRHRKFSYCLVDRNSNLSVSSTFAFGEGAAARPDLQLQYTSFLSSGGNYSWTTTYYYVGIRSVLVGGEDVGAPPEAWLMDADGGGGGTIIDSGTTLTYFARPAYDKVAQAFDARIPYPKLITTTPLLDRCYDVGAAAAAARQNNQSLEFEFPSLSIVFQDGAIFSPPLPNYVLQIEWGDVDAGPLPTLAMCLAILPSPPHVPSIIGNFLQQNTHFLYDIDNLRLGFASMDCAGSA